MCESDPERILMYCATNKKASTNYAVTLERLGKRDQARSYMNGLVFFQDSKVFNNLGIVLNRQGDAAKAIECYQQAIKLDPLNFFPNYNIGVLYCV